MHLREGFEKSFPRENITNPNLLVLAEYLGLCLDRFDAEDKRREARKQEESASRPFTEDEADLWDELREVISSRIGAGTTDQVMPLFLVYLRRRDRLNDEIRRKADIAREKIREAQQPGGGLSFQPEMLDPEQFNVSGGVPYPMNSSEFQDRYAVDLVNAHNNHLLYKVLSEVLDRLDRLESAGVKLDARGDNCGLDGV